MRIKTLELRNFRPYYGDIKVNFPISDNAPICLIHGQNGYGKTSLFLALNWCLYGHEKLKDAFEFFNIKARSERDPSMSVRLVFEDDGHELAVLRRINCNKQVKTIKDLGNTEIAFFEDGKKRQTQDDQILQELVDEMLPQEASQFSFFDGEKIEVYSSDDASEATQEAITSVLGISLLSRSKEDLEKVAVDVNKDRRRLLEREELGRGLADEMSKLDNIVEEAKRQRNALELQCKNYQSQELLLQDQLVAQEAAQTLLADIKQLQEKIDDAENNKLSLANEIKEATRALYLGILEPVLADQLAEAQRRRDSLMSIHLGAVRAETAQNLIDRIEQTGICICGRPADSEHIQIIRNLLELTDNKVINNANSNGLDEVKLLVSQLEGALALSRERVSYAELAARFAHIENDVDEWETSLAAKKSQLGGADEEAIASLSEALDRVKKDKGQAEREIGSLDKTIADYLAQQKIIENKIASISGQVQGLDLLNVQVEILNRSAEAFSEIVRRSVLAKQNDIQDASTHFFQRITNKVFAFERMIINDDFSFGVETSMKTRPPMALISAGEKQVTALSFILGLNEYTRRLAPIFMDTPMGRLDETHRRNVAKVLLELAQKGRQIILLVTDTDIAFGVYDILKPAIGAEFEIVHNQTDLTSKLDRRLK